MRPEATWPLLASGVGAMGASGAQVRATPAKPLGLCRPPSPNPARRHPDGGTGDQVSTTRKRKPEPAWFENTGSQGPCRLAPSQQTLGPALPQGAWLLLQSQQG